MNDTNKVESKLDCEELLVTSTSSSSSLRVTNVESERNALDSSPVEQIITRNSSEEEQEEENNLNEEQQHVRRREETHDNLFNKNNPSLSLEKEINKNIEINEKNLIVTSSSCSNNSHARNNSENSLITIKDKVNYDSINNLEDTLTLSPLSSVAEVTLFKEDNKEDASEDSLEEIKLINLNETEATETTTITPSPSDFLNSELKTIMGGPSSSRTEGETCILSSNSNYIVEDSKRKSKNMVLTRSSGSLPGDFNNLSLPTSSSSSSSSLSSSLSPTTSSAVAGGLSNTSIVEISTYGTAATGEDMISTPTTRSKRKLLNEAGTSLPPSLPPLISLNRNNSINLNNKSIKLDLKNHQSLITTRKSSTATSSTISGLLGENNLQMSSDLLSSSSNPGSSSTMLGTMTITPVTETRIATTGMTRTSVDQLEGGEVLENRIEFRNLPITKNDKEKPSGTNKMSHKKNNCVNTDVVFSDEVEESHSDGKVSDNNNTMQSTIEIKKLTGDLIEITKATTSSSFASHNIDESNFNKNKEQSTNSSCDIEDKYANNSYYNIGNDGNGSGDIRKVEPLKIIIKEVVKNKSTSKSIMRPSSSTSNITSSSSNSGNISNNNICREDCDSLMTTSPIPKLTIKASSISTQLAATSTCLSSDNNKFSSSLSPKNSSYCSETSVTLKEPHIVPKLTIRASDSCSSLSNSSDVKHSVVPKLTIKMDSGTNASSINCIKNSSLSLSPSSSLNCSSSSASTSPSPPPPPPPLPKLTIKTSGDIAESIISSHSPKLVSSSLLSQCHIVDTSIPVICTSSQSSSSLNTTSIPKLTIKPIPKPSSAISSTSSHNSEGSLKVTIKNKACFSDYEDKIEEKSKSRNDVDLFQGTVPKITIRTGSEPSVVHHVCESSNGSAGSSSNSGNNCMEPAIPKLTIRTKPDQSIVTTTGSGDSGKHSPLSSNCVNVLPKYTIKTIQQEEIGTTNSNNLQSIPKLTIAVSDPGSSSLISSSSSSSSSTSSSPIPEKIPKLTIRTIGQLSSKEDNKDEKEHYQKQSQHSQEQQRLPRLMISLQESDVSNEKIPKITIKNLQDLENEKIPKITIKSVNPDSNEKIIIPESTGKTLSLSSMPSSSLTSGIESTQQVTESILSTTSAIVINSNVGNNVVKTVPKLTIKQILQDSDNADKVPKLRLSSSIQQEDSLKDGNSIHEKIPKITIKQKHQDQDEVDKVPKITIKPIPPTNPDDLLSVSGGGKVPKLKIKPLQDTLTVERVIEKEIVAKAVEVEKYTDGLDRIPKLTIRTITGDSNEQELTSSIEKIPKLTIKSVQNSETTDESECSRKLNPYVKGDTSKKDDKIKELLMGENFTRHNEDVIDLDTNCKPVDMDIEEIEEDARGRGFIGNESREGFPETRKMKEIPEIINLDEDEFNDYLEGPSGRRSNQDKFLSNEPNYRSSVNTAYRQGNRQTTNAMLEERNFSGHNFNLNRSYQLLSPPGNVLKNNSFKTTKMNSLFGISHHLSEIQRSLLADSNKNNSNSNVASRTTDNRFNMNALSSNNNQFSKQNSINSNEAMEIIEIPDSPSEGSDDRLEESTEIMSEISNKEKCNVNTTSILEEFLNSAKQKCNDIDHGSGLKRPSNPDFVNMAAKRLRDDEELDLISSSLFDKSTEKCSSTNQRMEYPPNSITALRKALQKNENKIKKAKLIEEKNHEMESIDVIDVDERTNDENSMEMKSLFGQLDHNSVDNSGSSQGLFKETESIGKTCLLTPDPSTMYMKSKDDTHLISEETGSDCILIDEPSSDPLSSFAINQQIEDKRSQEIDSGVDISSSLKSEPINRTPLKRPRGRPRKDGLPAGSVKKSEKKSKELFEKQDEEKEPQQQQVLRTRKSRHNAAVLAKENNVDEKRSPVATEIKTIPRILSSSGTHTSISNINKEAISKATKISMSDKDDEEECSLLAINSMHQKFLNSSPMSKTDVLDISTTIAETSSITMGKDMENMSSQASMEGSTGSQPDNIEGLMQSPDMIVTPMKEKEHQKNLLSSIKGTSSSKGNRGRGRGRGGSVRNKRCVGGLTHMPGKIKAKKLFSPTKQKTSETNATTKNALSLQVFEEDTRMSAESLGTTLRQSETVVNNEDTQSSALSSISMPEGGGSSSTTTTTAKEVKKRSRMEVTMPEGAEYTVDMIAEYDWPPPKGCCPAKNRDTFMIQEQIAQYLGIKSFKRKYPDLPRRQIDMEERNYLQEKGLVTEKMCDLGITAVWASDVLDIMYNDFYDKYEEYKNYCRQKQLRDIEAKQKALAAEAVDKSVQAREKALQSASKWNIDFNKNRRDDRYLCLDLQSLVIQIPSTVRKKLSRPSTMQTSQPSHYPIALVPGQYAEHYRKYTSEELRRYPINTILEPEESLRMSFVTERLQAPLKEENNKVEIESDDDSDEDSNTSKSGTDDSSSSDSDSDSSNSSDEEETREAEQHLCYVCNRPQNMNPIGFPELFIKCSTCKKNSHPSCIEMPRRMLARTRNYNWQCADCKCCIKCKQKQVENKTLFCEQCDRCYHIYCLGIKSAPEGRWHCDRCAKCVRCGSTKPEGNAHSSPSLLNTAIANNQQQNLSLISNSGSLTTPLTTVTVNGQSSLLSKAKSKKPKWVHEYKVDHLTKIREHFSMLCVPCARLKTMMNRTTKS